MTMIALLATTCLACAKLELADARAHAARASLHALYEGWFDVWEPPPFRTDGPIALHCKSFTADLNLTAVPNANRPTLNRPAPRSRVQRAQRYGPRGLPCEGLLAFTRGVVLS